MKKHAFYVVAFIASTTFSTASFAEEHITDNCVLTQDENVFGKYVLNTETSNEKGETQRLGSIEQNQNGTWAARIENVGQANEQFNDYWQAAHFVCKYVKK